MVRVGVIQRWKMRKKWCKLMSRSLYRRWIAAALPDRFVGLYGTVGSTSLASGGGAVRFGTTVPSPGPEGMNWA